MLENWQISLPDCEPLAHLLRDRFPDRWVRFHSLPQSKRYSESEEEYRILFDRHNAVLGALTVPGERLVLLTTEYSEHAAPSSPPAESPGAQWWRSAETGEGFWHIYATEVAWEPARFDPIIRRVADDVIGNVMICDAQCRWMFHPYDGGMDVILDSTVARDALRERFKAWLSSHPDGL